jgi:hypothetical protein
VTGRDRIVIVIVAVVVAIAGSWFFVVQPKRDEAAKLGNEVNTAQSKLDSARQQVASNQAARHSFSTDFATLVRLGAAVPSDDNVPSMIYQLQSAATAAHVDFRDLALAPGSTSAATPLPSAPTASQASTAALPPGATVGPAGFPTEPFTFTFQGNFFHLSDFLGRVQRFVVANNKGVSVTGRLMILNAISLGAGPKGFPQISASIAATTYLIPPSQGLTNGASPAGPASPSTGQAVSTTAASPSAPATAAVATPVK